MPTHLHDLSLVQHDAIIGRFDPFDLLDYLIELAHFKFVIELSKHSQRAIEVWTLLQVLRFQKLSFVLDTEHWEPDQKVFWFAHEARLKLHSYTPQNLLVKYFTIVFKNLQLVDVVTHRSKQSPKIHETWLVYHQRRQNFIQL